MTTKTRIEKLEAILSVREKLYVMGDIESDGYHILGEDKIYSSVEDIQAAYQEKEIVEIVLKWID